MAIDLTQFKRSHCCQGTATAAEITETLKQIRQFDAKSEGSRRLMRWMMLFSFLLIIAGVGGGIALTNPILFFVALGAGIVFVLLIIVHTSTGKNDLPNRRYELLEDVIGVVRRDMPKDAPLNVSLDLAPPHAKRKKTRQDKVKDWNVTYYDDPWLKLSGKFADGTDFEIAMLERYQARKKWARSRSGKSKLKTKSKSATLTSVNIYPKQKKYANLSQVANQIRAHVQLPQWSRVKKAEVDSKSLKLTSVTTVAWSVKRTDPKTEFDGKHLVVLSLLSLYQVLNVSKSLPTA